MFSSNPLDKSCIGPDCTSGRNNASNRFPVGMTSLGDENQQIRIQLAVHKYNSSANSPLNSRCGVISPFRHSFQNNSLKPKCYEGEAEGTSKSDKRNGNQYEGVGAFPTIHLRKNAVRYRPIRRFKDVKVSYPELPVNRFLSHLPEACPDAKSSTRSVLDVLEDLSGKKIHAKDENGSSKPKSKGLAGDYLLNQNVVYKPLFVQKPKISSVLTRDNTTQTLSTLGTETPSPQSSNSQIRNDTPDPRAELRRKLAKQNNEIFASLSSSISLLESFSLKRKIDKVTPSGRDENLTDGSATKNPRIDQSISYNGNDMSKSANRSKNKAGEPAKFSRKSQLKETNSPTSPNKDRLTTIFLDMQNTSRKAQIFQNSSTLAEASKPAEVAPETQTQLSNGFTHTSNGFSSSISSSPAKGSSGTSAMENDKDNSSSSLAKANGTIVKKPEANNATFNLPVNQVNTELNNVTKPTAATFQFGVNASTPDLGATKTSTPSNSSSDEATSKKETDSNGNKKGEENSVTSKPFGFAGSNDKSNFGSFKFGAHGNAPAVTASPKEQNKTVTSEAAATVATSMPITTPQFSFGIPTGTKTATSQSFPLQFGVTNAQSTLTAPSKPLFAFGQNSSPAQQSSDAPKTEEKVTEQKSLSTSTAATATATTTVAQSIQSNLFKFGEKSVDSTVTTVAGQTIRTEVSPSRSADITFQPSANNLNANAGTALNAMKPSFSFGQKVDTTFTTSGTTSQEQKFTFTFGQKPATDQSNAPGGPKSTNLFSFGQKPAAQETPTTSVATNVVSTSQPATTQTTVFGLNASQAAGSPQVKFGEVSTSQVTTNFGTKPEGGGLGTTTTTTFNQGSSFPIKTSPFGFGTSTAQASTGLGTSTSNAPTFSFGASTTTTTQSTPSFGVSSTSQTTPTFGAISTAQSGFGMSSTTQTTPAFGATSTAQTGFGGSSTTLATSAFGTSVSPPAFGVSSTIQSTSTFPVSSTPQSFGVASTTQSLPAFKAPSVSQSSPSFGITVTTQSNTAFGVSSAPQSAPGFGASSTTQSTPTFAASTAFGMPTSSQASTVFGASGPSQPVVRFGAPVAQNGTGFGAGGFSSSSSTQPTTTFGSPAATSTSAFGTSQSSFGQPFNNKPPASLRPTTTIFGQNSTPTFSSGSTFNANPSNVFAPKSEGEMFDQNKIQTSGFGTTSQTFGNQNKFTFGMQQSTSNATGFTTSPPNTTSPPVFSFGGSATSNTFTFGGGGGGGGGTSMPGNAQTPFAFKSPTNEPFKFGTTTTKEGPGFGASPATFTFGQMNNNNAAMTEQKPTFSFGSNQASSSASSAPFAFGTTPSPSVFSFGGSTSGSTGSSFNFGTPTPGGPFGQTPTASPGAPFPVPGTFSIGSGSSQSRPRATSRPRRRP